MKLRHLMVFTHDSIGLGEDGPTHQPIEHAASLRLIPGLDVWRPADATETCVAWVCALKRVDGPSVFLLSRQNLPALARTSVQVASIERGGYVLAESALGLPQIVLLATGSEVHFLLDAQASLAADGISARIVSMPCCSRFDRQTAEYRASVLPPYLPVVSIEAGHSEGLRKYVGRSGVSIGIDRFGESAPAAALYELFGINAAAVVNAARKLTTGRALVELGRLPEGQSESDAGFETEAEAEADADI